MSAIWNRSIFVGVSGQNEVGADIITENECIANNIMRVVDMEI